MSPNHTKPIKVLLVEDNPADVKLIEIFFKGAKEQSFEVSTVSHFKAAVDFLKQHPETEVVLLDLNLPDSSRSETFYKAQIEFGANIPIIVNTGEGETDFGIQLVKAGAADFAIKGGPNMGGDYERLPRMVTYALEKFKLQQEMNAANQSLFLSEKRLRKAQKIAKIGNFEINSQNAEAYFSEEVLCILGYEAHENINHFSKYLACIPNEIEKAKVKQIIADAFSTQKGINFEQKILNNKNEEIYIRTEGHVEKQEDGILKIEGTIQDITRFKKTQDALTDTRQRYEIICNEACDGIFIVNTDGKIEYGNPAFCDMIGYTKEEIEKITINDFCTSCNKTKFEEEILKLGRATNESVYKHKDGSLKNVSVSATARKNSETNQIDSHYFIVHDITQQKQQAQLIQQKEIAEKSAELKEKFLANMSHEIRTPINVVIGMAHLLENTTLNPKQTEYVRGLKLSSENLLRLVNNVLDFSKIESGKMELEEHPVKVQELIKNLTQTHLYKAKEKKIDLFAQLDFALPETIITDFVRLEQILNNLISNALKYTEKGEVIVSAKLVEEQADSATMLFKVTDTGIGIPKEKHETIFECFTQASEETTRLYGGTGLGLSIVKHLVELFKGKLFLQSEVGKGSTFGFEITFKKTAIAQKHQFAFFENTEPIQNQQLHAPKKLTRTANILLVEDHEFNRIVASELLYKWSPDLSIQMATNGKEAIETLEQNPNFVYDLILMDISMPIMDGYQTAEYIRQQLPAPHKNTHIIAMTAHAFNKHAEKCFEVGMNDFITKPVSPEILYTKLNTFFQKLILNQPNTIAEPNATTQPNNPTQQPNSIITLNYIETLTGNNPNLKLTMLETVFKGLPKDLQQLNTDIDNQNWQNLKQSAHKLKSTTQYLGLALTAETLKGIEYTEWNNDNFVTLKQFQQQIIDTCQQAQTELNQIINQLKKQIIALH